MTKQKSQMQKIMEMQASFRFRLGAICALKPGKAFLPYGEIAPARAKHRAIVAKYSGKASFLLG